MSVEYTDVLGCYIWKETLIINKSAFATADGSEVNISVQSVVKYAVLAVGVKTQSLIIWPKAMLKWQVFSLVLVTLLCDAQTASQWNHFCTWIVHRDTKRPQRDRKHSQPQSSVCLLPLVYCRIMDWKHTWVTHCCVAWYESVGLLKHQ